MMFLAGCIVLCLLPACKDDDDDDNNNPDNGTTKDPVWTYDTQENPYGSTPWISGGSLVVCSRQEDPSELGTVHCVNAATGGLSWKFTDSTVNRTSPVVEDGYVIYGGYNVHALKLSDGADSWDYADDLIKLMLFSSPLLDGGYVYLTSQLSMIKLDATTGGMGWENDDVSFFNSGMPAPVVADGKIYYANLLGQVVQVDAASGGKGWTLQFDNGIDIAPAVTSERIYIGVHEADPAKNSLFCYLTAGPTISWEKKIGQVLTNMTLDNGKLYVVGNQTLYCLSAEGGVEQWQYVMTAGSISKPAISGGKVYIGNGEKLLCLDTADGKVVWSYTSANSIGFSSPTVSGGKLYVSCENGLIFCFEL
jgi:outer membrane protein assembly factor BamB